MDGAETFRVTEMFGGLDRQNGVLREAPLTLFLVEAGASERDMGEIGWEVKAIEE